VCGILRKKQIGTVKYKLMNNPKVSIIIPVYNTEQYLRQCLDSVINQTFKDIEIIVVNDNSTDGSYDIIKEYAKKDDRFIVINLIQTKEQGNARNEGLKIAKGKYITFIDSDDWVRNDFVEVLYNEIERNDLDVVSASQYFYDNLQKQIVDMKVAPAKVLNKCSVENLLIPKVELFIIPVWQKIYRKQFLDDNKITFKLCWHEDDVFLFETLIKTEKIKFIDDKIYFYRINRENSSVYGMNRDFTLFNAFDELKKMLIENDKYEEYKKIYYQYISTRTAIKLTSLNLPFSKLISYYNKFKSLYYNEEFVNNFSIAKLTVMMKMVMILFYLCLKFNMNYIVIGKFCRKIKRIIKRQS